MLQNGSLAWLLNGAWILNVETESDIAAQFQAGPLTKPGSATLHPCGQQRVYNESGHAFTMRVATRLQNESGHTFTMRVATRLQWEWPRVYNESGHAFTMSGHSQGDCFCSIECPGPTWNLINLKLYWSLLLTTFCSIKRPGQHSTHAVPSQSHTARSGDASTGPCFYICKHNEKGE